MCLSWTFCLGGRSVLRRTLARWLLTSTEKKMDWFKPIWWLFGSRIAYLKLRFCKSAWDRRLETSKCAELLLKNLNEYILINIFHSFSWNYCLRVRLNLSRPVDKVEKSFSRTHIKSHQVLRMFLLSLFPPKLCVLKQVPQGGTTRLIFL